MHERSSRTTFMASSKRPGEGVRGQGITLLVVGGGGQSTSGNMTLSKYQDWNAWRMTRRIRCPSPALGSSCCNIQIQFKDWVYRIDVFCSLRASMTAWLTDSMTDWLNEQLSVSWKWKRKWWKWTTAKLLRFPWFQFSVSIEWKNLLKFSENWNTQSTFFSSCKKFEILKLYKQL